MSKNQWNWNVIWVAFGIYIYLGLFQEFINTLVRGKDLSELVSPHNLILNVTAAIPFMGFTLVLYYLLLKYYKRTSTRNLLVILFAGSSSMIALRYIIEEVILRWITGTGNYREGTTLWYYFLDNTYYVLLYGSVGVVYYFIQYAFHTEREKSALEIENKVTQLQFLRNQVNPHFLFNSLNNIYSLVYQKSDNALPSVNKLSKLLRYSLYESAAKVGIDKEIEHIQNYMDLEQLRREKTIEVITEIDPEIWSLQIPPYLLLPFVENAYKHGDLHNKMNPITIKLIIKDNWLSCQVSNAIKTKQKDAVGGIGLPNIKKRLELLYGDKHRLHINNSNGIFIVNLELPLDQEL